MSKLPKKLIPFAEALDLYYQEQLIKVDFIVPVVYKIFNKQFNYKQLLKNGLPTMDDIYGYFGYPEIKNTQVLLPGWYFRNWKKNELTIKTLKLDIKGKANKDKIVFVELATDDEVLNTFVFFNPEFMTEYRFEVAFEFLEKAQEKEEEIKSYFK